LAVPKKRQLLQAQGKLRVSLQPKMMGPRYGEAPNTNIQAPVPQWRDQSPKLQSGSPQVLLWKLEIWSFRFNAVALYFYRFDRISTRFRGFRLTAESILLKSFA